VATLEAEFAATPQAAPKAREIVRRQLVGILPAPTLYDVLTIVSELVANGVHHGDGRYVRLHLSVAGGSVLGDVENSGRTMPRPREIAPDGSGMGLHIVDAIAKERRVILDDDSTIVRFAVAPP
jgi:anti-sigma regulatory factor (Ser/Thr protein kinase)